VLAVGGDGTANETAWGLLGSETALGLVPMGSGNGLAGPCVCPCVRTGPWRCWRAPCRAGWMWASSTNARS